MVQHQPDGNIIGQVVAQVVAAFDEELDLRLVQQEPCARDERIARVLVELGYVGNTPTMAHISVLDDGCSQRIAPHQAARVSNVSVRLYESVESRKHHHAAEVGSKEHVVVV